MGQSITIMVTRWTVVWLLSALALMLAMVLTATAPALAQAGEASATGTMEQLAAEPVVVDGLQICELSTHSITDEATGQYYDLKSDTVDLDANVGQRVTVIGTPLPTPAIGGAGAERCPDLNVTSIVPADDQGLPPSVEQTDLVAQLTVECPQNAGSPAGYQLVTTGVESLTAVPLTDEDGDGVLTGTQTFAKFPPGPQPSSESGMEPITVPDVRIVGPDGSTVKQFGPVRLDQDEILLPATISFCDGGSGSEQYSGGGQYEPGSSVTDSDPSSANGTGLAQLPSTGGILLTLGAGALLVGSGLLIRKIFQ